ncbi:hypothetical protein QJS04_geneDACA014510 [Acorus gramineus]|uniref:AT-hook motif nuclear-localized protein n=1 Tax=Acorus gramineus TaxID=55184 RepID=A0AAV9ARZ5_ACOGR|nr:hypothetical protein QJS04_geneDACA014510 [Acorus gramineus]
MEVRSEPLIMSGRESSYGVGLQKTTVVQSQPQQPPPQPSMQTMRLAFGSDGTAIYKPGPGTSPSFPGGEGGGGSGTGSNPQSGGPTIGLGGEPTKRKRGRPRKYGPDGTMALALIPTAPMPSPAAVSTQSGGSAPTGGGGFPSPLAVSPMSTKKARGRPPGSGRKHQMAALGSAGIGFTPHVITVKAGEDVSSKIMSFSQHGPRAVCILSANGAISNVTLRQAATSGGTVTYEGRFEILSLSGSFLLSESGGQRSRTGGLSVSLAGPDGRVLGGGVAGLLTAASPVQVVVGSFIADGRKDSKPTNFTDPQSTPGKLGHGVPPGPASPPSRGTLSGSSGGGGPGSPLNQSTGISNNTNLQGMSTMPWK